MKADVVQSTHYLVFATANAYSGRGLHRVLLCVRTFDIPEQYSSSDSRFRSLVASCQRVSRLVRKCFKTRPFALFVTFVGLHRTFLGILA